MSMSTRSSTSCPTTWGGEPGPKLGNTFEPGVRTCKTLLQEKRGKKTHFQKHPLYVTRRAPRAQITVKKTSSFCGRIRENPGFTNPGVKLEPGGLVGRLLYPGVYKGVKPPPPACQ